MVEARIINALTTIGLTRYEAEVYATLVELGEASAREIADKSTVPREKVYYVLRRLSKRGLAKMVGKNPIKYIALSPKLTLSKKISTIRNQLKTIEEAINALEEKYNSGKVKIKRRSLCFWEITYKPEEKLLNLIEACEERLDAVLTVEESIRVEESWYYILKKIAKKGIEVNVYSPLKDINVKSLGRLSNIGDVRIIDEILDYSLYVVDGEAGFIISDDLKMGIHFIDKRFCSFIIRLIRNFNRFSMPLESILNLIGYEKDVYNLLKRLDRDNFMRNLIGSFERLFIEYGHSSEFASKLLESYLRYICDEGYLDMPVQSIIDRVVSVASILDKFDVEVTFDDESGYLVYELLDDENGELAKAVKKGITSPPNIWTLLIQKAIELKGYRESSTVVIYDKRAGKWFFQKKFDYMPKRRELVRQSLL
ncbi:hypothetical protein DRN86_01900 [Candidatus Geothermarchaeota archaeon]|nr:MAG: hypothetical protein DRN86_01900 [Candidatus Geothermarchaeota archaeon]